MSNEYEEFIKYIFYEHIQKRLTNVRELARFRHEREFESQIARLIRASLAARFIKDYAESDEDIAHSFTPAMLKETVREVRYGVEINNSFVADTGIADIVQDYFGEIVDGMSIDYFPNEDLNVLQQSGSVDAHREIVAMIYLLKARKEQVILDGRQHRFGQELKETAARLKRIEDSISEQPARPNQPPNREQPVKRAIFKGIGQIAQGALMSIVDVTAAAGLWSAPLPPETTSIGAVVSIAGGIGTILMGVGELRGE